MKLPPRFPKHSLSSQKGEVATVLTLIGIGLVALGIVVGSRLVEKRKPTTVLPRAEEPATESLESISSRFGPQAGSICIPFGYCPNAPGKPIYLGPKHSSTNLPFYKNSQCTQPILLKDYCDINTLLCEEGLGGSCQASCQPGDADVSSLLKAGCSGGESCCLPKACKFLLNCRTGGSGWKGNPSWEDKDIYYIEFRSQPLQMLFSNNTCSDQIPIDSDPNTALITYCSTPPSTPRPPRPTVTFPPRERPPAPTCFNPQTVFSNDFNNPNNPDNPAGLIPKSELGGENGWKIAELDRAVENYQIEYQLEYLDGQLSLSGAGRQYDGRYGFNIQIADARDTDKERITTLTAMNDTEDLVESGRQVPDYPYLVMRADSGIVPGPPDGGGRIWHGNYYPNCKECQYITDIYEPPLDKAYKFVLTKVGNKAQLKIFAQDAGESSEPIFEDTFRAENTDPLKYLYNISWRYVGSEKFGNQRALNYEKWLEDGKFKFKVSRQDAHWTSSTYMKFAMDNLKIKSCSETPPIAVSQPNGGEVLTKEQPYSIKWEWPGAYPTITPDNTSISIELLDNQDSHKGWIIAGHSPGRRRGSRLLGHYYWEEAGKIYSSEQPNYQPDIVEDGSYKIKVIAKADDGSIISTDTSDAAFTIKTACEEFVDDWRIDSVVPNFISATQQLEITINGSFPSIEDCGRKWVLPKRGRNTVPLVAIYPPQGSTSDTIQYYRRDSAGQSQIEELDENHLKLKGKSADLFTNGEWIVQIFGCDGPATDGICPQAGGAVSSRFTIDVIPPVPPTTPIPQQAQLAFKVKLPDITSNISPIFRDEVQVEVYDGVEKFHTAKVALVKEGDYYQTQQAVEIPIPPSRPQIVSTIAVKQRVTLRRSFAKVILTLGETLDCTADEMIAEEPNPCGELFTHRDDKLLLSGDSDGFNHDSGSYNKIDSADLTALASQYNTTARDEASWAVDFNLDGQVNISDLGILGKNYLKQGD